MNEDAKEKWDLNHRYLHKQSTLVDICDLNSKFLGIGLHMKTRNNCCKGSFNIWILDFVNRVLMKKEFYKGVTRLWHMSRSV